MSYKKSSILVIAVLLMVSLVFGACGITEAIEKGLTSVSDWKNGAWKIRKEGDAEILKLWTDKTKTYYIGGYSLAGLFAL